MAENEILYIAGARRWRRTRIALRTGADAAGVAQCALEEMDRGLRNSLAASFRKGHTLLALLRAAKDDPSAARAVVLSFQDRSLAHLVSTVIQSRPSDDVTNIAHIAGDLIIDRVVERISLFAGRCQPYETEASRQTLSAALAQRFEPYRPQLKAILEHSLRGERVRGAQRPRVSRASVSTRAQAVASMSLLPIAAGARHATPRE